MTERLLQYIWQFQYFNGSQLTTVEAEPIQIIYPGLYNTNQGPDFTDAKIKINDTIWAGSVELHSNASDWKNHKHSSDKNYQNVILHVVWKDDVDLQLAFPTLVLADRISNLLLSKYNDLMNASNFIACEKTVFHINELNWGFWKQRLLVERLQNRSSYIFELLKKNNNHWEETFWWLIAKNFGIKVNSAAFESIVQSIPINVLAKHKNQIHQLEALLFGQAGLLDGTFKEQYPSLLQKEYGFLKVKYQLQQVAAPLFFLRMRPANFPSVRSAQLAMLVYSSTHLFAAIKESKTISDVKKMLNITANDYWHYHYMLDEATAFKRKNVGMQMIDNIIINTVVPILFAYGLYHKENAYKEKALQWLTELKAEKNTITQGFAQLNVENKNAFDSQALLQLKNEYCNKKRCLDCAIGNKLLKEK